VAGAVVVDLTFAVRMQGTTTLTLTGNPNPVVLNSNNPAGVISSITFDTASATVKGVSTGGGGY